MARRGGGVPLYEHFSILWALHHEEHLHLLGEVERERQHVAEEMEKLNKLRQDVLTDRGMLSTKEETAGVRTALEARIDSSVAAVAAKVDLYGVAVDKVVTEQAAQRARSALAITLVGIGLTALTIAMQLFG